MNESNHFIKNRTISNANNQLSNNNNNNNTIVNHNGSNSTNATPNLQYYSNNMSHMGAGGGLSIMDNGFKRNLSPNVQILN